MFHVFFFNSIYFPFQFHSHSASSSPLLLLPLFLTITCHLCLRMKNDKWNEKTRKSKEKPTHSIKMDWMVYVCCHACADIDQLLNYVLCIIDTRISIFSISCMLSLSLQWKEGEEKKKEKIKRKIAIEPKPQNCDQYDWLLCIIIRWFCHRHLFFYYDFFLDAEEKSMEPDRK